MNVRAVIVDRHAPARRAALGLTLVALVAASLGLAPSALAATTPAAGHEVRLARAAHWTAGALRAATALPAATEPGTLTTAPSTPRPATAAAPRATPAISGPALLFSQVTAGGSTIGRFSFAGLATTTVTKAPPVCVTLPRLSPDGNTIVTVTYSSSTCQSGTSTVATFNASTGVLVKTLDTITADADNGLATPSWSPDGTTVLYTKWTKAAGPQLYTVPAAGGTPTTLGGTGLLDGAYSPDGTKIVAAELSADNLDVLSSTGSVLDKLAVGPASSPAAPVWSPDGSKISFSYDKEQGGGDNYGIAVVNSNGNSMHSLPVTTADVNTNAFSSTWSSDGTQIFYDAFGQNPKTGTPTVSPAIYATDVAGNYRATIKTATATTVYVDPFFVQSGTTTAPTAATYTPIAPVRLLAKTAVGAGKTVDVKIAGVAGIPSVVSAVTLNLTGVIPSSSTYLTAYPRPSDSSYPSVSNLNLAAKQTAAIAVQVKVSGDGYVRIRNNAGTTGVIVDVSGYFRDGTSAAGYVSLSSPVRALDTTIGPAAGKVVDVAGLPGAPANASAVVLNLTADRPTTSTWETVLPSAPLARPSVSNLNLAKNATRANLVTAKIGADGTITVYNAFGSVRTIVDVIGYYASGASGLAYYPLDPLRILDTRNATRTLRGSTAKMGPGGRLDMPTYGTIATATGITNVPAKARAVAFNLTGVSPSASTYLATVASPLTTSTSSVNLRPGTTVPNLVISAVGGTSGAVRITNHQGTIAVVGDLAGYYAPA